MEAIENSEEFARLIPLSGNREDVLITHTPFLIGRKSNASLFLSDANISREHALIEETDNGSFTIRDLGSTNGTLLNRKPLGTEPVKLMDDDVITINQTHEYTFILPGKTMPFNNPLFAYGLYIDADSHQIYVDGTPISPDKRGYQLLTLLAENPAKLYTYAEIAERLYPDDQDPDSQVKRIRAAKNDLSKRLKSLGIDRKLIQSRSGIGYQLTKE